MAVSAKYYGNFFVHLAEKRIDFNSDAIKVALCTSAYTPDQDGHDFFNDITNEVTGTGYTAGGAALGSITWATTAANSWTAYAVSTAYTVGQVRRPTTGNGFLYKCIVAGTSFSSEPTWPTTPGDVVTETGGVKWANIGTSISVWDAADPTWASSTITARGAVVYENVGSAATDNLCCYLDFGSNITSTAATFTVTLPIEGLVHSWTV
jgi:hypothetical protein